MMFLISMRAEVIRPPESTVGAFGDKLRRQREQRGISLDAISTTTKISPRMLRAIEGEHFDQLPGGVFNKGFVRAYARQIGLDEEEAISDYLAALRESQIQSQPTLPNFRQGSAYPASEKTDGQPNLRDPKIDFAGNGLHAEDAATLHSNPPQNTPALDSHSDRRIRTGDRRKQARRSQDREIYPSEVRASADLQEVHSDEVSSSPLSFLNLNSDRSSPHQAPEDRSGQIAASGSTHEREDDLSNRVPWEKLAAVLLLITLAVASWAFRRRHQPVAASQPAPASPAIPVPAIATTALPPAAVAKEVPPQPPKYSSPSTTAANQPTAEPNDPDANPPVAKSRALAPAAKPPQKFTLVIRADQTSWVSITADGQPVAQETLIAPANTSVRASQEIIVKVGNTAGISFLLNGKETPAGGSPGEVRTFTFDATGMRASAAAQPAPTAR
jgi:hypothetical protein